MTAGQCRRDDCPRARLGYGSWHVALPKLQELRSQGQLGNHCPDLNLYDLQNYVGRAGQEHHEKRKQHHDQKPRQPEDLPPNAASSNSGDNPVKLGRIGDSWHHSDGKHLEATQVEPSAPSEATAGYAVPTHTVACYLAVVQHLWSMLSRRLTNSAGEHHHDRKPMQPEGPPPDVVSSSSGGNSAKLDSDGDWYQPDGERLEVTQVEPSAPSEAATGSDQGGEFMAKGQQPLLGGSIRCSECYSLVERGDTGYEHALCDDCGEKAMERYWGPPRRHGSEDYAVSRVLMEMMRDSEPIVRPQ